MKTTLALLFALSITAFAQISQPSADSTPANIQPDFSANHATSVAWFVQSQGFGLSRMPAVMIHPPQEWVAGEEKYLVKAVNLIGILERKDPVVYLNMFLHANMPVMKYRDATAKYQEKLETRKLSDFEAAALKQFLGTKTDVVNDSNTRIVGAIRAQTSCIQCHEVQQGDLMGAFSYVLEKEIPTAK